MRTPLNEKTVMDRSHEAAQRLADKRIDELILILRARQDVSISREVGIELMEELFCTLDNMHQRLLLHNIEVHIQTLYRWATKNIFPSFLYQGRKLVERKDAFDFIDAKRLVKGGNSGSDSEETYPDNT